jgi:hypothetical protein
MRPIVALCAVAAFLAAVSGGCALFSGGQTVSYRGYGGNAIVSADGRTVTVGPYAAGDCPAGITPVARESGTRVALFLEYVTPGNPPPCMQAAVALVLAHTIRLREPVGNRRLVDGATGRAIEWISSRLVLRPAFLPAGYRLMDLAPTADLNPGSGPGVAGCLQTYTRHGGAGQLMIVQSAGSVRVPGSPAGGGTPVTVRGHPGLATGDRVTRPVDGLIDSVNQVTWRENELIDSVQSGATGTGPDAPPVLSTQQLIAIADSAPAYNPWPVPRPTT